MGVNENPAPAGFSASGVEETAVTNGSKRKEESGLPESVLVTGQREGLRMDREMGMYCLEPDACAKRSGLGPAEVADLRDQLVDGGLLVDDQVGAALFTLVDGLAVEVIEGPVPGDGRGGPLPVAPGPRR